jgi:tetratricopeptide (TPR) repeat protein
MNRCAWIACAGLSIGWAVAQEQAFAEQVRAASTQSSAQQYAGSSMCLPPEVYGVVDQCAQLPAGGSTTALGKAPALRMQEAKRSTPKASAKKRAPGIELDMATRRNRDRVQKRAWTLLEKEASVLKRMIGNTPKQDARRPDILLRLAETYFEMQQQMDAKARSFDEPIFQAQQRKDGGAVRGLQTQQKQAEKNRDQYRQESLRTYAMLVKDHRDFKRMDEVLFSLAFGLDEMRQFDKAREVYLRLIKDYPASRFIPHAYLSFAEYYFSQGDMKASLQFYDRVTQFPPEKNSVYGYALYKQAWAQYNLENYKEALKRFVDVIDFAKEHPEARDAENLAKQSRRELVLPYAAVGSPAKALDFFGRYATKRQEALDMFESLGELYYDTGKWPQTITVYHTLMSENPTADKLCYWQSRVTNAVISSKPKAEQVTEIQRLVDLQGKFVREKRPAESKVQCQQVTASVLVESATAWHREAAGTEAQPGTNDKNTMRLASQLYRMLVENFADLDRMEFPDFDKRDWPTRYRVAYYHAELLWKMENWGECGPAFDRVVEMNPKGEYTQDAAYAAVLCYNNLYQQQYQRTEHQTRSKMAAGKKGKGGKAEPAAVVDNVQARPFSPLEKGMLSAFNRYLCYVKSGQDVALIKYRRARIYYEANQFEQAAVLFKDIAHNHKETEQGEYAATLYLDSLQVLGSVRKPPKPACMEEMTNAVTQVSQMYCNDAAAIEKHGTLCPAIGSVECGLLRKKAEAHQENKQYKDAAATYVRIFRRYSGGTGECSGRMDEVLYNAAINFEAARLLGRAIKVRKALIEKYPESPLAKRAIFLVGANYHALAIYSEAATYYEDFARKFPGETGKDCTAAERKAGTCAVATEALENATFFRIGLNDEAKALENVKLYEKNYRSRYARETAQVAFSVGAMYKTRKDWPKVQEYYEDFLKKYRRSALPHQVIRAEVDIGRALWESGKLRDRSEPKFQSAVKEWKSGAGAKLAKLGVDSAKRDLYLLEAKSATSEALFYLGEFRYREFQKINFPEYKDARSRDAVDRWAKTKFVKWIEQKRDALKSAEAAYNRISELEVPEWMIASAARVGDMYASFIDAFRTAPVPKEIESDEELYGIYLDQLEAQAQYFEKPAVDKFEYCLITATKVRWFNQWSQLCERELNRLNPSEYPMASELRGGASYAQNVPGRPEPVELGIGGEDDELGGAGE